MSKYPEHEKQSSVLSDAQIIGEFLEWLNEKYTLAEWIDVTDAEPDDPFPCYATRLVPTYQRIESILAEYYDIDLNKIESEKRAMLAELRAVATA